MRNLSVGLLGLGNVGSGVVKLLADNAEAIRQRLGGAAVEVKKIEQIVAEPVTAAGTEIVLQRREARHARLRLRHHLTVDERSDDRQILQRPLEGGKFLGPVQAAAGL